MGGIQMRINRREKILLGILVLALFAYLFYNFIYLSNEEKIANLEAELEVKNAQVEELIASINNEDNLNSQFKELNFEISDMSKIYLPDLEQEKLIAFMDDKLLEYNIDTPNINFNNDSIVNFTSQTEAQNAGYRYRLEELRDIYLGVLPETEEDQAA